MSGLDLHKLRYRTHLMRCTVKAQAPKQEVPCRTPLMEETEIDGRTTKVQELGFYCSTGTWSAAPAHLVPLCSTDNCVMHLGYVVQDAEDLQLVADNKPRMTLADMFRAGRSRGWFKGASSYAN